MSTTPTKQEARRVLRKVVGDSLWPAKAGDWGEDKDFADALDAFEAAVRAEALANQPKVKLRDCRGIIETINGACTCGGNGPGEGCPACEVYHGIADMEFVKG